MHLDLWLRRAGGTTLALALVGASLVSCSGAALAPSSPTPASTPNAVAPVAPSGDTGGVATGGAVPGGPSSPGGAAAAQPAPRVAVAPASGVAQSQAPALPPAPTPNPAIVHGITVTGTGEVRVKPDRATITAGVQTRAVTAQDAQAQNNTTMQKVIDAIKALGIPDANIRTSGVSLYPVYVQDQTVTGYNATNTVTVLVDNLDQVGAVLDAATKAGANLEGGVSFSLKNDTPARDQALQAAAADAKSKATALAGALGLQISSVQSVSEGVVATPINVPRVAAAAQGAAPSVPVEPGEMTVTAQVTVVFGY